MRLNRIFIQNALAVNQKIELPADAVRHLVTVLKMREGNEIVLFNGDGNRYLAIIEQFSKKHVTVCVREQQQDNRESPLSIHLIQGVSRGDKMDFSIQKAVELGVSKITPLFSERCGVKLTSERLTKKLTHWQNIVISACEQCGRNRLPELRPAIQFEQLVERFSELDNALILDPHQGQSIKHLAPGSQYSLIIGPEGGFSDSEVEQLRLAGCQSIQLGPRILRTETAGLTAISLLQGLFGDF